MELKPDMYVRTKEFGIQKIKWFDNEEPILENGFTALQKAGYKASHNIIDLIEVGDYVNGDKVLFKDTGIAHNQKLVVCLGNDEERHIYDEVCIKSIVTKEQFESMSYKVGE